MKRLALLIMREIAAPRLLFGALVWLMLLLVAGTLAQRWLSAHEASRIFFGGAILWLGPLPLPGGGLTLGLICVNLAGKLLLDTAWRWRDAGIIVTHAAVLFLMAGGLIAATQIEEGFVALAAGEKTAAMSDYMTREFVVLKDGMPVSRADFKSLHEGQIIEAAPFTLTIRKLCRHCAPASIPEAEKSAARHGLAAQADFESVPPPKEEEAWQSGASFTVAGADSAHDGLWWSWEGAPQPVSIDHGGSRYDIVLRRTPIPLPFSISLTEFTRSLHPGTDKPSAYVSRVVIEDGKETKPGIIEMNQPLRHGPYVIYQSSYARENGKEVSVLTVMRNPARELPYYATALLAAGLLLHILIRAVSRRVGVALIVMMCGLSPAVSAAELSMQDFRQIPVLHDGRVKPLDSFARALYGEICGVRADGGAIVWLADALFDPRRLADAPIIDVADNEAAAMLGLDAAPGGLYPPRILIEKLGEARPLLEKLERRRAAGLSRAETYLLALAGRIQVFQELSQSLTILMPLDGASDATDYMEAVRNREAARQRLKQIVAAKGDSLDNYDPGEIEAAHFAMLLDLMDIAGARNRLLRVVPPQWPGQEWSSPWAVMLAGAGSPATGALLDAWRRAMTAWRAEDSASWNAATHDLRQTALAQAGSAAPQTRLALETFYYRYDPFLISLILYGMGIAALTAAMRFKKIAEKIPPFASLAIGAALAVHGLGLALRVYLLGRPPVSNLYESVLFVGFIVAASAFGWSRIKSNRAALWIAGALGLLLQIVAMALAPAGDTLGVLLPVLNTKFWLTTHVICITAGYALCLVTAALAHYALWQSSQGMASEDNLKLFALLSLLFTATGTLLGGIWADQSWGRFWGWDPKENGALLIVLWLIWLLHGRIAGQFSERGFTAGLSFLSVVVALAWFGVNFLGIGLHSYGFAEQGVMGLAAFIAVELAAIAFLLRRGRA